MEILKVCNRICVIAIVVFATGICNAQTVNLKPAPANITINGMAEEWGDSLPFTNDKAKLNYTISNDKTNLYMVVKTKDAAMQSDILGSGITFSVNTKGKKSTTYSLTFPARIQDEDPVKYMHLDPTQTQAKAVTTKYRKIKPEGFKDIKDEELSTSNPYGIQVAIGYDDEGYLVYEEAIPLTLFHTDPADKEWAFNIKINGLERDVKVQIKIDLTGVNSGRAIPGSDAANLPHSIRLTPPVDFWEKFVLAK